MLRFSPYFLNTVHLEKYKHTNTFLYAAMIPRDHRTRVFVSEKEVLYNRNAMREAACEKNVSIEDV